MRRFLVAVVLLAAHSAAAQCPCYSVSTTPNTYQCGIEATPGTNPTVADWQPIFLKVAGGPQRWGTDGPALSAIASGCGHPVVTTQISPVFPCELLQAIAMNESGWRQFCAPTTPASQKGLSSRTIISFDCGYGIGQVTSGMHIGDMPTFDRARVAGEPAYNLATGAQILGGKWRATACVGDRQPSLVEDWYIATWAYNGLAAINDPNNASYDTMRPICNPNLGCPMRPYQERVFGWMEHPPTAAHWPVLAPAYPDRASFKYDSNGRPLALPEPTCAGPTDCTKSRSTHVSRCLGTNPPDAGQPSDGGEPAPSVSDGGQDISDGGDGPGQGHGCQCDFGGTSHRSGGQPWVLFALLVMVLCRRARSA